MQIFQAGFQGTKVRGFMWFALLVGLGFLYWGFNLSQTYGLSPGDGGVLRPPGERLAWGFGVGLLGVLLVASMYLYGRLYIGQVLYDEAAGCLTFETLRWWGKANFTVPQADVIGSDYHHGQMQTIYHTVNAPFHFVRLKGRRLPLILDGQGQFTDFKTAARLLGL